MGLDMYLYAKRYLMTYPADNEDSKISSKIAELLEVPTVEIQEITAKVAYWRKANHIHKWFVDKVQSGVDECQHSYVSREKLKELLSEVHKVRAELALAPELLPTTSGFFFGSTEYDEYYLQDLELTEKQITKALELSDDWDFEYHSSW